MSSEQDETAIDPPRWSDTRHSRFNKRGEEHYRDKYETAIAGQNLLIGFVVGLVVGVFWEVLRSR